LLCPDVVREQMEMLSTTWEKLGGVLTMKRIFIYFLGVAILSFFASLMGCTSTRVTPQPTDTSVTPLVSISDVEKNPGAFRDKHVRMQGYGLIMATLPLCQGYVGLDRRTRFVDAKRDLIPADVRWKPPENFRMYDPDNLRVFDGYIRIFSGEIGCPAAIAVETFPYFEIVGVE